MMKRTLYAMHSNELVEIGQLNDRAAELGFEAWTRNTPWVVVTEDPDAEAAAPAPVPTPPSDGVLELVNHE